MRVLCELAHLGQRAGSWVVDAGANIGTFSLPLIAAGVNVLAFEASSRNAELLRASIAALRRSRGEQRGAAALGRSIVVGGVALHGRGNGTVCLVRPVSGVSNNQGALHADRCRSSHVVERLRTTTVDLELASLFGGETPPLAALKVDVEGGEAEVLAGGRGRLIPALRASGAVVHIESKDVPLLVRLGRALGADPVDSGGCDNNWRFVAARR